MKEQIAKEFEKYLDNPINTKATMFGYGYETDRKGNKSGYKNMAQGFFAGFEAAERLAKIHVIEQIIATCNETHVPDRIVMGKILEELKAETK